jgi:hypothetical protein
MYISLEHSRTKGFRKWADVHQPDDSNSHRDRRTAAVAIADSGDGLMPPPEHQDSPWLVPGAGRL